jgi:hypothetical protein
MRNNVSLFIYKKNKNTIVFQQFLNFKDKLQKMLKNNNDTQLVE